MDDIVRRAMQKWPDVPQVYGWLRLDRRGQWWVKGAGGAFERIANAAVVGFIQRNYAHDDDGRWFFQNGPQRVFVALDYTPWVYRLSDACDALVTHTGRPAGRIEQLLVDEAGALLVQGEPGVGVVDDRDMAALVDRVAGNEAFEDDLPALIAGGAAPAEVRVFGRRVALGGVRSGEVAGRFAFEPAPQPPPGAPDC